MDTSESILSKSLTSQTTANASASSKEPSPRKDNIDNSASGTFILHVLLAQIFALEIKSVTKPFINIYGRSSFFLTLRVTVPH